MVNHKPKEKMKKSKTRKTAKVRVVALEIESRIEGERHFSIVNAAISKKKNKKYIYTKRGFPRYTILTTEEKGKVNTLVTRYGKLGRPAIQSLMSYLDPRSLGQVIRYRLG
jgi:hypothetical protein